MAFELYDYVAETGVNEFKVWTLALEKIQRAKLNARLDMLKRNGDALFPEILAGTGTAGILKLKIKGNVQLRPLLCRGPMNAGTEYTMLMGATEVGGKLKPKNADATANRLKAAVIADSMHRRMKHERVS